MPPSHTSAHAVVQCERKDRVRTWFEGHTDTDAEPSAATATSAWPLLLTNGHAGQTSFRVSTVVCASASSTCALACGHLWHLDLIDSPARQRGNVCGLVRVASRAVRELAIALRRRRVSPAAAKEHEGERRLSVCTINSTVSARISSNKH